MSTLDDLLGLISSGAGGGDSGWAMNKAMQYKRDMESGLSDSSIAYPNLKRTLGMALDQGSSEALNRGLSHSYEYDPKQGVPYAYNPFGYSGRLSHAPHDEQFTERGYLRRPPTTAELWQYGSNFDALKRKINGGGDPIAAMRLRRLMRGR